MSAEYDERDAQIWGEVPALDGIDLYAREVDPFYSVDDWADDVMPNMAAGHEHWDER